MNNTGITWRVVSPARPVLWPRGTDETWLMNPPLRYVITSDCQHMVQSQLLTWSDLKGTRFYRPLQGGANLNNTSIVVERHRDRGIGDLLFTTGPLAYMQHNSSHTIKFYYYASTDRSHILHGNPCLANEMPMSGPVIYDSLPMYNFQWFIESATEYDEEPEQMNVYDVLYKQIGIDPATVAPEFKRPVLKAYTADKQRVDDLFRLLYFERHEDWRKTPFWVVAPTSTSSLRSAPYGMWLKVIEELAKTRHVIVVGQIVNGLIPHTDMAFSQFQEYVCQMASQNKNVVNLMGRTPMRLTIGMISCAEGVVTLDSGLLYVAQGLRVPAVSVWGPQHPATRIGYDQDYMDLAVWERKACDWSPCFAYRKFPEHKCPLAAQQHVCEPLKVTTPAAVLAKIEKVLARKPALVAPVAAGTPKK